MSEDNPLRSEIVESTPLRYRKIFAKSGSSSGCSVFCYLKYIPSAFSVKYYGFTRLTGLC
jgi:hypothetical protein